MILAALIAITLAAVAIIAAVAFCVDAKDKRNRAEAERDAARDDATRWAGKYAQLQLVHRQCPTSPRAHLRVVHTDPESWVDDIVREHEAAVRRRLGKGEKA